MKEVSTAELQEMVESGKALNLVDVREADEVATGIIPGAIHIPLGDVVERLGELDKNTPYILICRSGGRSGRAAAYLEGEGYDVTNMAGGMLEWDGTTEVI